MSRDGDVTITLPRDMWETILNAMNWPLPTLGDHSPGADTIREHSEASFRARARLEAALA